MLKYLKLKYTTSLLKVVNVVGEKAVAAAKVVSGHETVIANKNALLSELSHCCVMLGISLHNVCYVVI